MNHITLLQKRYIYVSALLFIVYLLLNLRATKDTIIMEVKNNAKNKK